MTGRPVLNKLENLVIKVGTSILSKEGRFDKSLIVKLSRELAPILKKGVRVSIVSSGAIGAGMTILKEKERPKTMEGKQAAAAVGQRFLMQCYEQAFSRQGYSTAQVLLTWDDMANPKRFMNARRTLREIQRRGLVPVINENDTVATEEIRFGDNDRLSALLSILIEADALIILSNTDGLYSDSKLQKRIKIVEKIEESIFSHVKDSDSAMTVGGMRSKLEAIQIGVSSGIPVYLADGRKPNVLEKLLKGEDLGTYFMPSKGKAKSKKNWMLDFMNHVHFNKNN